MFVDFLGRVLYFCTSFAKGVRGVSDVMRLHASCTHRRSAECFRCYVLTKVEAWDWFAQLDADSYIATWLILPVVICLS